VILQGFVVMVQLGCIPFLVILLSPQSVSCTFGVGMDALAVGKPTKFSFSQIGPIIC